jgi:hypothetical protein
MITYSVKTAEGFEHRFSSKAAYEAALSQYTQFGQAMVNDTLIERHNRPSFSATGKSEAISIPAFAGQGYVQNSQELNVWNAAVLKENQRRINKGLGSISFWHYKAAREIAGTFDIADTIAVLDSDFEKVAEDAQYYLTQAVMKGTKKRQNGCGKTGCANGWVITKNNTARPCGCRDAINSAYLEALRYS